MLDVMLWVAARSLRLLVVDLLCVVVRLAIAALVAKSVAATRRITSRMVMRIYQ